MADMGFPSQHTTATTVTTNTSVQTNIRFDSSYLRMLAGILKCIQIVSSCCTFLYIYYYVHNPSQRSLQHLCQTKKRKLLCAGHTYYLSHIALDIIGSCDVLFLSKTLNLIGFISIQASGVWALHSRGGWYSTVSMGGFWFTGILLVFYLFHVIEKFYKIPWLKIEFVFCAIWTVFYLIASCLAVTFPIEAYIAAGVSKASYK